MSEEAPRRVSFRKAILREILTASLLHPATLFPAVGAILGAASMVVFEPSAGVFLASLGLAGLSGASAIANFFFRGPRYAERYVQRLAREREASGARHLEELRRRLGQVGAGQGLAALDRLLGAERRFGEALPLYERSQPVAAAELKLRSGEVVERGLAAVERVVAVTEGLGKVDEAALQREAAELARQVGGKPPAGAAGDPARRRWETAKARLEEVRERLRLHEEGQTRVIELLAIPARAESMLEKAILALAAASAREAAEGEEDFGVPAGPQEPEAQLDIAALALPEVGAAGREATRPEEPLLE